MIDLNTVDKKIAELESVKDGLLLVLADLETAPAVLAWKRCCCRVTSMADLIEFYEVTGKNNENATESTPVYRTVDLSILFRPRPSGCRVSGSQQFAAG